MTVADKVLLDMIRHALFGGSVSYPADIDWNEVLRQARLQSVSGIAAAAVPDEVKQIWRADKYAVMLDFVRITSAQQELTALMASKGIPMAILKGTAAAIYYPSPEMRAMGDIDFIVTQDRFEEAKEIMLSAGFFLAHEVLDPGARHIGLVKDNILFELHHHFSYYDLDIERYIIEGFSHLEKRVIPPIEFTMLPKLANGLVLLAHMRFHLQSGIGLRQVIDWMMYTTAELDDDFWESSFSKAAEEVGLRTLAVTVTRMCQLFFGMPQTITWCQSADEDLCETLLNSLLSSGNFGRKEVSGKPFETVMTAMRKEGILSYLQRAGEYNWKAYRRHKWLKPFAWAYQICRYSRQFICARRGSGVLTDLDRSNERYELLRRLEIN